MKSLETYARHLASLANLELESGQIFAKILTPNDDSGRHGVLIPTDAYSLFPPIDISDPNANATTKFDSFDAISRERVSLAFKYYQRYPECRITRVNTLINDQQQGYRLQIVLRGQTTHGETFYVHDSASEHGDSRFHDLWQLLTGGTIQPTPGVHLVVPIRFKGITVDAPLQDLLTKFDAIHGLWHDALRIGDTGIGYTFESLLGIKENNDKTADFRGIELKCKRLKNGGVGALGKVNLFQQSPQWAAKASSLERLKTIGQLNDKGQWVCYSQVTTAPNNLNLCLSDKVDCSQLDLHKNANLIGYWPHHTLEKRLLEKHSRAAFVLADVMSTKTGSKFRYKELIYCEQPTIARFLELVSKNQLVFEFMMSEKTGGKVRNHGYPWRLVREDMLDQLFAVRVKLR
ncbi:MAG: MvaI/BcnI family restriction endonuclease [Polaromonas sp.]